MHTTTPLQVHILDTIRQHGPIPFAEYMRMALYEPGQGYYVSGKTRVGWEGDFFTSSDVSEIFAHCTGRQLLQMWEMLKQPTHFLVLEQGANRGLLGEGIRAWASQEHPAFHQALHYVSSDIGAGEDALSAASEQAPTVLLSNELVDAFPVHLVEKRGSELYEVYVGEQNGRFGELLQAPSSEEVASYLDDYKIPWRTYPDGWRAEINLDARHWMRRSTQLLLGSNPKRKRRGFLLAIDYGDLARQLYIPERFTGTLACYYQHQLTERPLMRPGEQDITAHVNFSTLIEEGRRQGLRLHKFTTQRAWLTDMGIYEELERIRQRDFAALDDIQNRASDQGQVQLLQWYNVRQRVSALTSPGGLGGFKVLILKR